MSVELLAARVTKLSDELERLIGVTELRGTRVSWATALRRHSSETDFLRDSAIRRVWSRRRESASIADRWRRLSQEIGATVRELDGYAAGRVPPSPEDALLKPVGRLMSVVGGPVSHLESAPWRVLPTGDHLAPIADALLDIWARLAESAAARLEVPLAESDGENSRARLLAEWTLYLQHDFNNFRTEWIVLSEASIPIALLRTDVRTNSERRWKMRSYDLVGTCGEVLMRLQPEGSSRLAIQGDGATIGRIENSKPNKSFVALGDEGLRLVVAGNPRRIADWSQYPTGRWAAKPSVGRYARSVTFESETENPKRRMLAIALWLLMGNSRRVLAPQRFDVPVPT